MIRINKLTKKFTTVDEETTTALSDVDLEFGCKGLVVVVGPSGCGKTTLLNMIAGFDRPSDGYVETDGNNMLLFDDAEWDAYRSKNIGFIFQDYMLMEDLSVTENIELPLALLNYSKDNIAFLVEEVKKELQIKELEAKNVRHLSGGQKQRVAIARAIVKNPEIILADEPTGNLDEENSQVIFQMLKRISEQKLVIVVTHDTQLAKQYADRIIELSYGSVKSDVSFSTDYSELNLSEQKTNRSIINNQLPFAYNVALTWKIIKKRIVRNTLTVIIISFLVTAVLALISIIFRDKSKTLNNYLKKNGIDYITLVKPIEQRIRTYNGNDGLMFNETGKRLFDEISNKLDTEAVFLETYVSITYKDCSFDARLVGVSALDKGMLYANSMLASLLQIDESQLPLTVSLYDEPYSISTLGSYYKVFEDEPCLFLNKEIFLMVIQRKQHSLPGLDICISDNPIDLTNSFCFFEDGSDKTDLLLLGFLPKEKNEIAVSEDIFRRYLALCNENIVGKEFNSINVFQDKFGNAFWNSVNLFDYCGSTITVVGVIAESENTYFFNKDVFNSLCFEELLFRSHCWLEIGSLSRVEINELVKQGFWIKDENMENVLKTWENFESNKLYYLFGLIAGYILLILLMVAFFSYSIKDNNKKIGVLRSLGVPQRNINNIFIVESLVITFAALSISIVASWLLIRTINQGFCYSFAWDRTVEVIKVIPWVYYLTIVAICLVSVSTVLIPLSCTKKYAILNMLNGDK